MPHCKIACTNVHGEERKVRSNPADGTARPPNLRSKAVCAGPRAAAQRQLTPLAACAAAVIARAAAPCPDRLPDTSGSPANAATGVPPAGILHGNNDFANAAARTAGHSLSADTAGADDDNPLAVRRCAIENDAGPRELATPAVQVSKRSANFASRRLFPSSLVPG